MKLNDEQARYAEEHHGIVYSYLNNNGLSDEEWYGIVAFGFLRAAVNYDKEKGAFSSFAYLGMRDAQLT